MARSSTRLMITDICAVVFLIAQIVIFPLIQFTPADPSAFWSYVAIVLVAVMAFLSLGGERSGHLIRIGIAFTLVADYFLVLKWDKELEGVIAFIFVQIAYCLYLLVNERRRGFRLANLIARLGACLILPLLAIAVLREDADALAIASVIYYANLIANAVFAFTLGKRERMLAVGLALFAMCDLCIGLEVLFSEYLRSKALDFFYGDKLNLPWVFYQPSQVLIALHLYRKYRKSAK